MAHPLVIGLVEDNPADARLIQEMLREPPVVPFRVDWSSNRTPTPGATPTKTP